MIFTRRKLFCFKIYLLERASRLGGMGGRGKEPSFRLPAEHRPSMGLNPRTHEIMT